MKLFAHARHIYEDRATRRTYEWNVGQWLEIPDELGKYLLTSHPTKFCDISAEAKPELHSCRKDNERRNRAYALSILKPEHTTELIPAPPVPGSGRVSRQRLYLRRQALKRSRRARVNIAARG